MPTIYFVGMHNKPGHGPLCSRTRSGKIIDAVIAMLAGYAINAECCKTNLCDCDYLPPDNEVWIHAKGWLETYEPKREDVVVLLGAWTHEHFPSDRCGAKIIKVRHPASLFGAKGTAEAYQAEVMQKILSKLI